MSKVYSIKDLTNYENHIGYDLRTPDGKDIRFSDNIEHNPFMYNEIKEILDDLRTYKDRYEYFLFNNLSFSDRDYKAKILLDYITNLQEIVEEHKNCTRKHWQQKCAEHYANEMIYKSRNEKAIELLNNHDIDTGDIFYKYNNRFVKSELKERIREVLGGDDNE